MKFRHRQNYSVVVGTQTVVVFGGGEEGAPGASGELRLLHVLIWVLVAHVCSLRRFVELCIYDVCHWSALICDCHRPSHLPWQHHINGDSGNPSFHLTQAHRMGWWLSLDHAATPRGALLHWAYVCKTSSKWLNLLEEMLCEGPDLVTPGPNARPAIEQGLTTYFWSEWVCKFTSKKKKLFTAPEGLHVGGKGTGRGRSMTIRIGWWYGSPMSLPFSSSKSSQAN